MDFYVVPVGAFILLWLAAGAALPFIGLWDRRQAASRRRALFDKSADQLGQATCGLQIVAAAVLAAGYFLDGSLPEWSLREAWHPVLGGTAVAAVAAALFSVLGRVAVRRRRAGRGGAVRALTWLSGLGAALSAMGAMALGWGTLCGLTMAPVSGSAAPVSSPGTPDVLGAVLTSFRAGGDALPWLYALLWLFLAVAAGQGVGLCWHLLRRNADDYGRDYYTLVVSTRARQAAYAGAASLAFAALFLWLAPGFRQALPPDLAMAPPDALIGGFPLRVAFRAGSLGLLLAVLCWYLLARTPLPLRRKTLAFLALPLLWIGVACLLGCLWG